MKTLLEKFTSKYAIDRYTSCWNWIGAKDKDGYGFIGVKEDNKWKSRQAHRVSWILFVGVIPEGLFVLHRCDNPSCVNPDHLFLGTQQDNGRDMLVKNRNKSWKGESHPMCRLTDKEIEEIRSSPKSITLRTLMNKYNIHSMAYMCNLRNGKIRIKTIK